MAKKDDAPLSDAEIAARMERAIKKSFTMPPKHLKAKPLADRRIKKKSPSTTD